MRSRKILHQWLSGVMSEMQKKRRESLEAVIAAAIKGSRLTVTGLGRSIESKALEKHNIKRADRLISNKHLQSEAFDIYRKLANKIIGKTQEPVILIDWSDIEQSQNFFILRAAMPVKGRSFTIYEEVHDIKTKEKPSTHLEFLKKLKLILPENCKPILVTDAGFRVPWFKQVQSFGWNFVGRVRNRDKINLAKDEQWIGAKSLYSRAKNMPISIKDILLTQRNSFECNIVLYKGKAKGKKRLNRFGQIAKRIKSLKNAKRGREPWLLATSLSRTSRQIVNIYSSRMQIEESFRDLKCVRNGFGFDFTRSYQKERIKILLLIGTLAAIFTWTLGKAIKLAGRHKQFQANTTSSTPVLSNVFIGVKFFINRKLKIPIRKFNFAIGCISLMVADYEK